MSSHSSASSLSSSRERTVVHRISASRSSASPGLNVLQKVSDVLVPVRLFRRLVLGCIAASAILTMYLQFASNSSSSCFAHHEKIWDKIRCKKKGTYASAPSSEWSMRMRSGREQKTPPKLTDCRRKIENVGSSIMAWAISSYHEPN